MQEEFGDALQVLFVECQGATPGKAKKFALEKKWLGTQAAWTTERPFHTGTRGLPNFALLDAEGRLVLKGYSNSMHKEIEETIARLIRESAEGPAGTPSKLKGVYRDTYKGSYAKAHAHADKFLAKAKDDAENKAGQAAIAHINAKVDQQWKQLEWQVANGHWPEAQVRLKALQKGIKGVAVWESKAAHWDEQLQDGLTKEDLAAAKTLARMEVALFESGKADGLEKPVRKILDSTESDAIRKRAQGLLDLAVVQE